VLEQKTHKCVDCGEEIVGYHYRCPYCKSYRHNGITYGKCVICRKGAPIETPYSGKPVHEECARRVTPSEHICSSCGARTPFDKNIFKCPKCREALPEIETCHLCRLPIIKKNAKVDEGLDRQRDYYILYYHKECWKHRFSVRDRLYLFLILIAIFIISAWFIHLIWEFFLSIYLFFTH
jgi:hypothetical protein